MSTVEEDTELRDLVSQTLEKNGSLAKIRAELRASIFLALEEDIKLNKQQPLQNLRVQSYLETPEGRTMFCLVREFLEFFNLQFTISVYEPESYLDSIYEGRQKIAKDLGLEHIEEPTVPLLQHLLKIAQTRNKVLDINLNVDNNINGSYKEESFNVDSSYKKTDSEYASSKATSNNILTEDHSEPISDKNNPINNSDCTSQKKTTDNSGEVEGSSVKVLTGSSDQPEFNRTTEILNLETVKNLKLSNGGKNSNNTNNLNETFDVRDLNSLPINCLSEAKGSKNLLQHNFLKYAHEDDTYEDTSSIAEDSEVPTLTSLKMTELTVSTVPEINLSDISLNDANNAAKLNVEGEKSKNLPQRSKTLGNCLSDLSTIVSNKTKISNAILPSLYNKESKDKTNSKDLDKIFDMEIEYEEDFLCSSNDLSLTNTSVHSVHSKNNAAYHTTKSSMSSVVEDLHYSDNVLSEKLRSLKQSRAAENGTSLTEHSLSE
ncbi:hypothetical protein GWI33_013526 [Rhynchophorus ferrugineus]|uniref:FGFR1 oncogene partner (FOP) N-terminal dimerisation domain-containing protein n=1 Tax=Rhynchophorus ferrugineus TaxID=354439 RepID=A0A834I6V1_RHYFE|nr:hypothetical protein GWI33_013526 [Rhynchophorus ferrugineus]